MTCFSISTGLLTLIAVAAGTLSSCHRKSRQADGPAPFQPAALVQLHHPAEAPSRGPIPIDVTLNADARTYWDNQGVLDQALNVLLVRRDRPGVLAVAKIDPAAMMAPTAALPGRPSATELATDRARTIEHKHYDVLAYGRQHPGAANYFVIGSFADAWAGPSRLDVTDPGGPLAPTAEVTASAPAADWQALGVLTSPGVTVRLAAREAKPAFVGAFRTSDDQAEGLCLTLVLGHLRPTGGALVRQFRVASRQEHATRLGTFAVPLAQLDPPNPAPPTGRYILFAFVGNEAATPTVIEL